MQARENDNKQKDSILIENYHNYLKQSNSNNGIKLLLMASFYRDPKRFFFFVIARNKLSRVDFNLG